MFRLIASDTDGTLMENARPALKAVADRVVGCNRDHAVQQELRRVLESLA